jgi:hypothetical protein
VHEPRYPHHGATESSARRRLRASRTARDHIDGHGLLLSQLPSNRRAKRQPLASASGQSRSAATGQRRMPLHHAAGRGARRRATQTRQRTVTDSPLRCCPARSGRRGADGTTGVLPLSRHALLAAARRRKRACRPARRRRPLRATSDSPPGSQARSRIVMGAVASAALASMGKRHSAWSARRCCTSSAAGVCDSSADTLASISQRKRGDGARARFGCHGSPRSVTERARTRLRCPGRAGETSVVTPPRHGGEAAKGGGAAKARGAVATRSRTGSGESRAAPDQTAACCCTSRVVTST